MRRSTACHPVVHSDTMPTRHRDVLRVGVGRDPLDRFLRGAGPISYDADALRDARLASQLATIVHVAALLEDDTAITVRQGRALGVDRAADLAVFLPLWDLEEAAHGAALRALLADHEYPRPVRVVWRNSARRRLAASIPLGFGRAVPATEFLFCTLGAAAEYVATMTYAEIASALDDPAAAGLVRTIARQEARHFAFFLDAARRRGERMSALDGRFARRVLRAIWQPIGVPTLGPDTWRQLFGPWIAGSFGRRVERMDRIVDTIPHLDGMHLMGSFLQPSGTPQEKGRTRSS